MGTDGGAATSLAPGRPVLGFEEIGRDQLALVGGKGAHLGELCRVPGVAVPPGFCVTTEAYARVVAGDPELEGLLDRLAVVDTGDREALATLSARVREVVEALPVPDDVAAAVTGELRDGVAYAVRSSATAEDLPTASFAGQQDTYLNVVGAQPVLDHVRRCWASLFTERAVAYRVRGGIDQRQVRMAVVVQEMVDPDVSGVLFTADPVTSDRTVTSVEAVLGLGEALVSGQVNADRFTVRGGAVVERVVADKERAVRAEPGGGTRMREVDAADRDRAALTDAQVLRLAELGARIAAAFGAPQDVEWCLAGDEVLVVQSRPITTLFPVPESDGGAHVYLSVGHQQMMTDAMRPLGLSFWQRTTPRPMAEAGGRLFADATPVLASAAGRENLLLAMHRSDPLMEDALRTLLERGDLLGEPTAEGGPRAVPETEPVDPDPAVVAGLVARTRESLAVLAREIRTRRGPELVAFIEEDLQELRRLLFDPFGARVFMTAMNAAWWLDDHLGEWLGPEVARGASDTLTLSVDDSITSEMGLALLDVADVLRPLPEVVELLRGDLDDGFLDELPRVAGGTEARDAIRGYLDAYGARCAGEIDITRPRWVEQPTVLVPVLLAHIDQVEPGESARRFAQGRAQALAKEEELLALLRAQPDGAERAAETATMIERLRTFIGYREYPKFGMVCRYLQYRLALLREADRLVAEGVLADREDAFFLRFDELAEVLRTGRAEAELIARRRAEFRDQEGLTPPRVLTSDGECLSGSYRRADLPPGALAGLGVSAGVVEGRARVVLDMAEADLGADDILVTAFTDPSWSPVFVTIKGLVTEVGGQMTHGAVVAREYGLPAVVGVQDATRRIPDGSRIRVDGTGGVVEILS